MTFIIKWLIKSDGFLRRCLKWPPSFTKQKVALFLKFYAAQIRVYLYTTRPLSSTATGIQVWHHKLTFQLLPRSKNPGAVEESCGIVCKECYQRNSDQRKRATFCLANEGGHFEHLRNSRLISLVNKFTLHNMLIINVIKTTYI